MYDVHYSKQKKNVLFDFNIAFFLIINKLYNFIFGFDMAFRRQFINTYQLLTIIIYSRDLHIYIYIYNQL